MTAVVMMYTTASCHSCIKAKSLFDSKGVAYTEVHIDREPARLEEMIERSGGRRTVPQIFINHRHVGGFDDLWALDQAGKLDELLHPQP